MHCCGLLWVFVDPNAFLWEHMGPYWVLSVLVGLYRSLCIPMDTNGSLSVFIGPFAFLWVPMSPYRSLCVFKGAYGSI